MSFIALVSLGLFFRDVGSVASVLGDEGLATDAANANGTGVPPEGDSVASRQPAPELSSRRRVPLEAPSQEAPPTTAEAYLASYWGDEWAELRAAIAADDDLAWVLSRKLDASQIPRPWEQVQSAVVKDFVPSDEAKVSYAAALHEIPKDGYSAATIASLMGLPVDSISAADVDSVRGIASAYDAELEQLGKYYADGLSTALESDFLADRVKRGPLVMPGTAPSTDRRTLTAHGVISNGWCVAHVIYDDDHPDLVALREEAAILRRARSDAIRSYMKSR